MYTGLSKPNRRSFLFNLIFNEVIKVKLHKPYISLIIPEKKHLFFLNKSTAKINGYIFGYIFGYFFGYIFLVFVKRSVLHQYLAITSVILCSLLSLEILYMPSHVPLIPLFTITHILSFPSLPIFPSYHSHHFIITILIYH